MKFSKPLIIPVIFILSVLPSHVVSGNDTFVHDNGSVVYPINTDKVQMVWEEIKVSLQGVWGRVAYVDCLFEFENISSNTVKATLGFPAEDESYYYDGGNESLPFHYFQVYVNGKLTKSEYKDKFFIWEVTFPPKEKVMIRNKYGASLSFHYYKDWFEYIMTTGANWKGPIERATVTVQYKDSDELYKRLIDAQPENFRIKDNKIIWEFRNFIPDSNIKVTEFVTETPLRDIDIDMKFSICEYLNTKKNEGDTKEYTEDTVDIMKNDFFHGTFNSLKENYTGNYYTEERLKDQLTEHYVKVLRYEIYARHGELFRDKFGERIFDFHVLWYKTDYHYSDALLNDYEKRNIKFLSDYEKKRGWSQESMQ